jgi:glycosyltransferase involved in cell wall biosynthesis
VLHPADVIWRGPVTDPSGTAGGARALVHGLAAEGSSVRLEPRVVAGRVALAQGPLNDLLALAGVEAGPDSAVIHRCAVPMVDPYAPGRVRVAHVCLPSVTVPEGFLQRLSLMDALWVPSTTHADVLAQAGIPRERIGVVPEAVELDRFTSAEPLELPDAHGTVFVAPLEWGWRTEWDSLLDAWCRAFRAGDDVTLVLAFWSPREATEEEIQDEVLEFLARHGHDAGAMADVVLLGRELSEHDMPGLYAAADVVVAPTHSRGGGRTAVEAMASGRAVIAPVRAGDERVDASVGWPVPTASSPVPRERSMFSPAFAGAEWPQADVDALAEALRDAHDRPDERTARGERGRARAVAHGHRAVARGVQQMLAETEPRLAPGGRGLRPAVAIEGAISGVSSLAGINRELARAFAAHGGVDLGLVDTCPIASTHELHELSPVLGGLLPAYPDVTIHHAHPPEFLPRSPGRSVQIAHWEYGPPPADWAGLVRSNLDEVWVVSTWVRDWFVRTGMDESKIKVIPLGIDPDRFRPGIAPMDLGDAAPGLRFLFVGGMAWRKGADLIASAFGDAFTDRDDITLVIKTYGATGPYRSDGCDELIEKLRTRKGGPRVHMITDDISDADMPGLYAACDCLVHPYRGEAFGMTMLEAMACGLPVVIPDMGAARDFADENTALLVPSHTRIIPSFDATGQRMTEYPVVVEMESDELAATLRRVYENPEAARAVGAAAATHAAQHWTWARAVEVISERVAELGGVTMPV